MTYDLDRTIDAIAEPVTVDQAKAHCRVDVDDDDALFGIYIAAARQYCEKVTGRAFLQQTWRLSLDRFPMFGWRRAGVVTDSPSSGFGNGLPYWRTPEILLPRPKLIGIVSITYLDLTGTRQTLDPSQYQADFDAEPARVQPATGTTWPATIYQRGSVQVTFTCGYGPLPSAVPATLQLAILQLVGHWYENREATVLPATGTGVVSVPIGVADLLDSETFTAFTLEN